MASACNRQFTVTSRRSYLLAVFLLYLIPACLSQDKVTISPSDPQIIRFGETLNLTCEVPSDITVVTYEWTQDGMSVDDSNDSVLTLSYMQLSDAEDGGTYHCIITEDGNATQGANLSVSVSFEVQVQLSPLTVHTTNNSQVTLTCNATGFPSPVIQWYRLPNNTVPLTDDITGLQLPDTVAIDIGMSYASNNESTNTSTLTISQVDYEDFGYYICVGTQLDNAIDLDEFDISNVSTVTVSPADSIMVSPPTQNISYLESANFNCTAEGGPSNMFRWYRGEIMNDFSSFASQPINITDFFDSITNDLYLANSYISVTATTGEADGGVYTCVVVNEAGFDTATVNVYINPRILTQPMSQFVNQGDNVTLACVADSFPSSTYQWQRMINGTFTNIDGANNSNYIINNILHDAFGRYRCVATANGVSDNSSSALITISPRNSVTIDRNFITVDNSSSETFTCTANGGPNNAFVWVKRDSSTLQSSLNSLSPPVFMNNITDSLSGTTILSMSDSYTISSVTAAEGGTYSCIVFNQAGLETSSTLLHVRPIFTREPTPRYITNGTDVSLTCQAESFPSPSYQWYTVNVSTREPTILVNETSSTLDLGVVTYDEFSAYQCVVNATGTDNSISVFPPTLITVSPEGSISVTPSTQTLNRNDTATFTCTARGGPNNTIIWIRGDQGLTDSYSTPLDVDIILNTQDIISTGSVLQLESITGTNGGYYTCIVINEAGFDNATVNLLIVPEIITQPIPAQYVTAGDDVSLSCEADSFPSPTYQWERMINGVFTDIFGANDTNYTINDIEHGAFGRYRCVATANGVSDNSSSALITISPNNSVTITPNMITVDNGSSETFTCTANGGPNNMFVWVRAIDDNNQTSELNQLIRSQPLNVTRFLDILSDLFDKASKCLDNLSRCLKSLFIRGQTLTLTSINATQNGGEYLCIAVNEAGPGFNRTIVHVRPTIIQQPEHQYVTRGDNFTLTCLADAFPPPSYQWERVNSSGQFNEIEGEVNNTLEFTSVDYDEYGSYRCIATSNGDDPSNAAIVTISPEGSISVTPSTQTLNRNDTATFTCTARGGPNNTIIWIRGDQGLTDSYSTPLDVDTILNTQQDIISTGSVLQLESITGTNGGYYTCIVINEAGFDNATVNLLIVPEIITPPNDRFVTAGDNVSLSCVADSFPSPTYQWEMMDRTTEQYEPLTDSTDNTLNIMSIEYEQFGRYRCVATANGVSDNSSSALITVSPAGSVVVSPETNTVSIGESANFNCSAEGGPYNAFRWIKGNVLPSSPSIPLDDVTVYLNSLQNVQVNGSSFSLPVNNGSGDGGSYTCVVVNRAGISTDNVTVYVRPVITTQPQNQSVNQGDNVTLTCVADSFPSPNYQWQRMINGMFTDIDGANEFNYIINNIQHAQFGRYQCVATTPVINAMNTSNEALITVSPRNSVNIDPNMSTVDNGTDVTFNCTANGGPNNTFIWVKRDANIYQTLIDSIEVFNTQTGGLSIANIMSNLSDITLSTDPLLTITSVNATQDGGTYTCYVFNEAGVESSNTTLYVRPIITEQPNDRFVTAGNNVSLSCLADSFPSPTYQWEMMCSTTGQYEALTDSTDNTLNIMSIEYEQFGRYRCVATATGVSDNSSSALITISPAGSVVASPENDTVSIGESANFNCSAEGGPYNVFRWIKGGVLPSSPSIPLNVTDYVNNLQNVQVNGSSFSLPVNNGSGDGGLYTCVVVNRAGISTDNVTVYVRPVITTQPQDQSVNQGDNVTLTCVADSFPSPTYQWQRMINGVFTDIPGANEFNYIINNIQHAQFGRYQCVVTTPVINAMNTSNAALITVSPRNSVNIDPNMITVDNGTDVTFNCTANGGPNNTFIWVKRDTNIYQTLFDSIEVFNSQTGGLSIANIMSNLSDITLSTDPLLTITSVNATQNGGTYTCYVFNEAGVESSNTTLYVRPIITEQPQNVLTNANVTVSLSCRADSFPPPSYQWRYFNTTTALYQDVPGATSSVLTFNSINYEDFGDYHCVSQADGIEGNATSFNALITVSPLGSLSITPAVTNSFENSPVPLTCNSLGGPDNIFQWTYTRTGEVVGNSSSYSFDSSVSTGGNYQCLVRNQAGNDTVVTTVNVGPVITLNPISVNVSIDTDDIMLTCEARGIPVPVIIWTHNGTVLNPNGTEGTFEDDISVNASVVGLGVIRSNIVIPNAMPNNTGDYTCNATSPVTAYDSVGSTIALVLVQSIPETPFDLEAVNVTSRNLTLTWTEPHHNNAPILGYYVQYPRPPFLGGSQVTLLVTGSDEELFIDELHPGFTYSFRVIAFNEEGNSSTSEPEDVLMNEEAPSGYPQGLSSVTVNSTAINVTWSAVLDRQANGIIRGYTISVTPSVTFVDSFERDIPSSVTFEYLFTGLQEYVNYTFTILARTNVGNGPSSPFSVSLTDEAVPFSSPQNFTTNSTTPNSIDLSWNEPPPIDINGVIDNYTIRYQIIEQLGVAQVDSTINTINTTETMITLSDLGNYTVYNISVSAVTIGEGPANVMIQRTDQNVPGAPAQDVVAVTESTTNISLTWSAPPLDMTFGIITSYEIEYGEYNTTSGQLMNGTKDLVRNVIIDNNSTFYMLFDGLQEAREYGFRVRAITVGPGPYSTIVTNTTFQAPPSAMPSNLTVPPADQAEPTSVTLSWAAIAPDDANGDLEYRVSIEVIGQQNMTSQSSSSSRRKRSLVADPNSLQQCLLAANINNTFNETVPGNQTSLTLNNIAPYTQYQFFVTGVTPAGSGPPSPTVPFNTSQGLATMPQILNIYNTSDSSLNIMWAVPACDNGVRTGFRIYYAPLPTNFGPPGQIGNPSSPIVIDNATTFQQNITGLTPHTAYRFHICATTSAGCGDNITREGNTTQAAPLPITNINLSNPTSPIINVTWTRPSERNGTFLYEITYFGRQDFFYSTAPNRTQSADTMTVPALSGSLNNFDITNALPFANYTINVLVYNELFGRNLAREVVTETTRTLPTAASQVTNFTASTQNSSSILVSWSVPLYPNGIITEYRIRYTSSDSTTYQSTANLFHIIHNLDNNIIYNITVQPVTMFTGISPLLGVISETIPVNLSTGNVDVVTATTSNSRGVFTFIVNLPRPEAFGSQPVLFYGVIVANIDERRPSSNLDLEQQYPNPQPHTGATSYYIGAGWNPSQTTVPTTFKIGDGSVTTATRGGVSETYTNIGLKRQTNYCILAIVYLDSGIDGEPLIRYAKIVEEETRLGYNAGALGFFMTLIILLIIVAILAVVFFFVYRRYKTRFYSLVKKGGAYEKELENINGGAAGSVIITNPPVAQDPDEGKWVDMSSKSVISVSDFPAHVANMHANDDYLFSVEYPTIEPQHHPTKDATQHPDNAIKNRYANITAYDHSRVLLKEIPNVPGSDYINANFIDGYKKPNAFIASQGPVPHSIADFWRMVWEQNTETIVMLTNLEEKGRIKCHLYWPPPDKRVIVHGQIRIELQEELCLTDYTIRTFSLQHKVSSDERIVKQFHFTSWPDFGVPEHATNLLRFIHKVERENSESAGPIVVHCSAGVGRTGTFVTIMCQIKQILDRDCLDIFNFVQGMRYRRCFMVQTEAQYIFIHDALLEYLECGETEVSAREVKEQHRLLGEIADKEDGKTRLEKEFDNIQDTIHNEPIVYSGTLPSNRRKNRYANVIPFDKTRCKLSTIPGVDGSDYINANFIEGYHKGKAFIATQGPLPDTTDDFWRMVWEHKCATIVMLANEREGAKAMCHKYWPDSGSEMYGFFEVTLYSSKEYPDYVLREFKIVDSRDADGSTQHVKQYQYTTWPSQGVPDTAAGLLDVREQAEKWQRNSGDKPIIVHCSGGCGRTGTYIAVCLLIDRLKTEGLVDVFQVVRGLRLQRPGMVRSVDQYEFCYKSILEYLGSFDTYANFSL